MNPDISIEQLKDFTPQVTESINNLLKQLNPQARVLTEADVREIIAMQTNRLFVAKEHATGQIIGMITLITYIIPYAKKALLEDFVISESYRSHGIGSQLMKFAIQKARDERVKYIELTSNPTREAANLFYQKMGFQKRETNVYRFIV